MNPETAGIVVAKGADTIVAGSDIFGKADRKAAVEAIRKACG
jgi:pentose-5-phosphate-3-epimerase